MYEKGKGQDYISGRKSFLKVKISLGTLIPNNVFNFESSVLSQNLLSCDLRKQSFRIQYCRRPSPKSFCPVLTSQRFEDEDMQTSSSAMAALTPF